MYDSWLLLSMMKVSRLSTEQVRQDNNTWGLWSPCPVFLWWYQPPASQQPRYRDRDPAPDWDHRAPRAARRGCAAATGESESKKLVLVFPSSPSPSSSRTLSAGCAPVLSNFDIDIHIINSDTSFFSFYWHLFNRLLTFKHGLST